MKIKCTSTDVIKLILKFKYTIKYILVAYLFGVKMCLDILFILYVDIIY